MPKVRALRCLIVLFMTTLPGEAPAQAPPSPFAAIYPGRCETPVSERTGDAGCYLLATEPVDGLSEAVYWHLYTYPTLAIAQAARSAQWRRGAVPRQVLGVYNRRPTMETCEWRARGGHRAPPSRARRPIHGAVYGIDHAAGGESRGRACAFWTGGLLRVVRHAVPRDTRRHDGDDRRRERHHA